MRLAGKWSSGKHGHRPSVGNKLVNAGEQRLPFERPIDDTLDAALPDGDNGLAGGAFHTGDLGKRSLDHNGAKLPVTP